MKKPAKKNEKKWMEKEDEDREILRDSVYSSGKTSV